MPEPLTYRFKFPDGKNFLRDAWNEIIERLQGSLFPLGKNESESTFAIRTYGTPIARLIINEGENTLRLEVDNPALIGRIEDAVCSVCLQFEGEDITLPKIQKADESRKRIPFRHATVQLETSAHEPGKLLVSVEGEAHPDFFARLQEVIEAALRKEKIIARVSAEGRNSFSLTAAHGPQKKIETLIAIADRALSKEMTPLTEILSSGGPKAADAARTPKPISAYEATTAIFDGLRLVYEATETPPKAKWGMPGVIAVSERIGPELARRFPAMDRTDEIRRFLAEKFRSLPLALQEVSCDTVCKFLNEKYKKLREGQAR